MSGRGGTVKQAPFRFVLSPEVKGKVLLACLHFGQVEVKGYFEPLWREIDQLAAEHRARIGSLEAALPVLQPARTLYRQMGVDPTKHRPSSEALLRRVLKGTPLYQINTVVDTCNLCSLRFLLPIGLYDTAGIRGQAVQVRRGVEGESYGGIGKGWLSAAGKLILADEHGPFGNPSADSARTGVTLETRAVLMVIFAPGGYSKERLHEHMEFAISRMARYCAAVLADQSVIS